MKRKTLLFALGFQRWLSPSSTINETNADPIWQRSEWWLPSHSNCFNRSAIASRAGLMRSSINSPRTSSAAWIYFPIHCSRLVTNDNVEAKHNFALWNLVIWHRRERHLTTGRQTPKYLTIRSYFSNTWSGPNVSERLDHCRHFHSCFHTRASVWSFRGLGMLWRTNRQSSTRSGWLLRCLKTNRACSSTKSRRIASVKATGPSASEGTPMT